MNDNSKTLNIHLNLNQQVYFISDAHAGSSDVEVESKKEKLLCSFFDMLMDIPSPPLLYIVGDLFDFWFEYRHAIPTRYQKILGKLTLLQERGVEIRYVTGNHDFWMGDFFPRELKIPVFHGIHSLIVGSKKIHISHGDGVLKEDTGYRVLKKILRNKWVIATYKLIHPDIGIPFAHWASSTSRNHGLRTPEQARKDDAEYFSYAKEQLDNGFDHVIIGHTHRPKAVSYNNKRYINLGDWIQHFTFANYNGEVLNLFRWNGNQKHSNSQIVTLKNYKEEFIETL